MSIPLRDRWDEFINDLNGIELITQSDRVAKLSQDYYSFSPVLQPLLSGKRADAVVRPTNETEVLRVASACARYQIPLTVRGAGTGNYGQCVPLKGGIVLDVTAMQTIKKIAPGIVQVEPGAKLSQINKVAEEIGWELRLTPSTYRTATIGGFIGGGSGGIGSVLYGWLSDRGNVLSAKVVTLEAEPRVIVLRGDDIEKVNHAYGTNGIIIELEIALAPVYPWAEIIVVFQDFMQAARFGQSLAESDGIIAKLISIHAWPIPSYFTALQPYLPAESHAALLICDRITLDALTSLVADFQGTITYSPQLYPESKLLHIGEFTWNHTTLHARATDSDLTYLQSRYPYDKTLRLVEEVTRDYQDEIMMHLEFTRSQGAIVATGLEVLRFSTTERLQQIINDLEQRGIFIANPHTYILEDGGTKEINPLQLNFKRQTDPHGLLNPGKMRGWWEKQ